MERLCQGQQLFMKCFKKQLKIQKARAAFKNSLEHSCKYHFSSYIHQDDKEF